ncbi:FG-GAP-like repeat-containing protein [Flavobacterium terrigena]|uniref:Por secretion system C-terminal sorting domain-containing protein n=1 Tax=Flavobacterium terrigena TaxID=402734 RepID=A0A1H6R5P7_9FLAO|nr:FG-GAP-like repeat-containing protein [Flavobacterium terrigena]SEI46522.1 Por secretion system C-terminal sorting domain-containing protein [Flavobacterium terrigena]
MKKTTTLILLLATGYFASAQDTCASALTITPGNHIVSAVNGTDVPTPICAANGTGATKGEWYIYIPTQTYTTTVSTNIAANTPKIDTRFHVYTGICGAFTCVGGDDDSGANLSSVGSFTANAGTTYYIAWDNRWSSAGFTFQLTEATYVPPIPTPINYTTQTISTINSTYNSCIVDMNGDYKDDIVGVSANNLKVHYQGAGGTFTVNNFPITGTSDMPSWSLAAGDYNRDGFNDLVLGSSSGLTFWQSNNTGTTYSNVNPSEYIFCQRTNFIDINNDGNLDAFSCHDVAPNVYYLNNGTSFTHYQSGVTPGAYSLGTLSSGGNYASIWTDYDNDGDSDMFISKCSGPPCELHRNDGNGVFTDVSAQAQINFTPVQSWSSAVADFDNDGDMDILIGANGGSGQSRLYRNNLDTSNSTEEAFTNITVGSGWDSFNTINRDYIAYDFDNNGFIDVMGGGNKIMFNQGNNTFSVANYSPYITLGAIGDLNNDGFLDIANGSAIHTAVPNGNNWVKVTLQGIQSNRNGIGARVEIYGTWGKQIRDIRSGEGFEFMSTLNAHFGIGTATAITQIKIIWPSGTVDVITNPNINQSLNVIEGNFPLSATSFNGKEIKIYPNPTSDYLSISNLESINVSTMNIIDTTGKTIKKVTSNFTKIDVSNLSEGIYILSIETKDGKKFAENFIKK